MRIEGLQQLAQHVQLYESQDGHHKRHSLGHKIEVTGGHAHQRECHQYCGRHSHNYRCDSFSSFENTPFCCTSRAASGADPLGE